MINANQSMKTAIKISINDQKQNLLPYCANKYLKRSVISPDELGTSDCLDLAEIHHTDTVNKSRTSFLFYFTV